MLRAADLGNAYAESPVQVPALVDRRRAMGRGDESEPGPRSRGEGALGCHLEPCAGNPRARFEMGSCPSSPAFTAGQEKVGSINEANDSDAEDSRSSRARPAQALCAGRR